VEIKGRFDKIAGSDFEQRRSGAGPEGAAGRESPP
jgi:hypothetical protein